MMHYRFVIAPKSVNTGNRQESTPYPPPIQHMCCSTYELRFEAENKMTQMDVIPSQKWLTADPALVRPNRRACSQVLHTTSIKQVFSKCFIIFRKVFLFVGLGFPLNLPDVGPSLDRKAVRDQNIRTQNTIRLAISQREQTNSCSSSNMPVCASTKRLAR